MIKLLEKSLMMQSGEYLGGALGHFGSLGLQNCIKKMSKIEAWPPLLQVGHQALGSKSPDFGRKMGRNLSVTISNSDLCSSQIF